MVETELQQSPDELAQIRESVRALCAKFPGEYWRALDRERSYPAEVVTALTPAGFLAALIPEDYGGRGRARGGAAGGGPPRPAAPPRREEPRAGGTTRPPCHAQMYTMGTLLRH